MADKPIRSLTAKLLFDADLSEANRFQKKVDSIKGSTEKLKGSMKFKGGESTGLWGLLGLGGGKRRNKKKGDAASFLVDPFTGVKIPKPKKGLFKNFIAGFNEQLNSTKTLLKENAGKIGLGVGAALTAGFISSTKKFAGFERGLESILNTKGFGSSERKQIKSSISSIQESTGGATKSVDIIAAIKEGLKFTSNLDLILKTVEASAKLRLKSDESLQDIASGLFSVIKGDRSSLPKLGFESIETQKVREKLNLEKDYGIKMGEVFLDSILSSSESMINKRLNEGLNLTATKLEQLSNTLDEYQIKAGKFFGGIITGSGARKIKEDGGINVDQMKKERKERIRRESQKAAPGVSMKVGDINVNMKSTGNNQEDGKMIAKFIGSHMKTEMQKIIDYNVRHTDTQGSNAFDPPNIQAG